MTQTVNEILNEASPRWAELTGTKLGATSWKFTIGSDSSFQEHDLAGMIDDLNAARHRDVSGTTAILLLRGLFAAYAEEQSFSAHELLFPSKKTQDRLATLRGFHALVHQPSCEEAVEVFRARLREATSHYSYDLTKLQKMLDSELALGQLLLAAARSLDRLTAHQFVQGAPDPTPLRINREIFEFWNINSLLAALHHQQLSGITLALIRDPNVYKSYFVFGIRNGETITVLTDFQEGAHPNYHRMTRRPERQLDRRARENWFPYRLLEKDSTAKAPKGTALVPMNKKAIAVDEIPNLEPTEFVWLVVLVDLIADRYGRDDTKLPELSYTGEMVTTPHALVDASHALVQTGAYQPLVLPTLTVETATPEAADTDMRVGHNAWLEERYRHRVPAVLLDVVGERKALEVGKVARKLLPGDQSKKLKLAERQQPGVIRVGGYDKRKTEIDPEALDPTYFGTRRQIDRNRVWAARVNLIQAVQRLATAEFVAKHKTILKWCRARLERNIDFIIEAVVRGELKAPTFKWKSDIEHGFPAHDERVWTDANILTRRIGRSFHHAFLGHRSDEGFSFGRTAWPKSHCYFDEHHRATIFARIVPGNARALAVLFGIAPERIPWPLQHWTTHEPYTGNSILDRIDPQDSRLDDPWRHLDLSVNVMLCKRDFKRLCKLHGVEYALKEVNDE